MTSMLLMWMTMVVMMSERKTPKGTTQKGKPLCDPKGKPRKEKPKRETQTENPKGKPERETRTEKVPKHCAGAVKIDFEATC